jgi:hypothetical protein
VSGSLTSSPPPFWGCCCCCCCCCCWSICQGGIDATNNQLFEFEVLSKKWNKMRVKTNQRRDTLSWGLLWNWS